MNISRRDLFYKGMGVAASGAFGGGIAKAEAVEEEATEAFFKLHPVGKVEKKGKSVRLQIFDKYADALEGLDDFSHAFVFYWFDKSDTPQKRSILQVHPHPVGNKKNPLTGVFACRAPVRPNLIALSMCRILSVKDVVVHIDRIDAFDNSPILDIKPYIPSIDKPRGEVQLPYWLGK